MNRILEIARTEVIWIAKLGIAASAVGSLAMWFDGYSGYLQNLYSFPHLFLCIGLLGGLGALALKERRWLLPSVGLVLIHGAILLPLYTAPEDHCVGELDVVAINIFVDNEEPEKVVEYVKRIRPEVLFVSELLPESHALLAELYPYSWSDTEVSYNGLYSQHPILEATRVNDFRTIWRTVDAVISIDGQEVRVLGVHPPPPITNEGIELRDWALADVARRARGSIQPVIVLGDFNATMWTPGYAPLGDLKNGRDGRFVGGTWPRGFPAKIPIDHILTSENLGICSFEVGEDVGSDHLPVRASISLRPSGTLAGLGIHRRE